MEKIRKLRESRKLSQAALAEKIGLTNKKISDYESGATNPPIMNLKKIADFFNVPIDSLFDEENDYIIINNKDYENLKLAAKLLNQLLEKQAPINNFNAIGTNAKIEIKNSFKK